MSDYDPTVDPDLFPEPGTEHRFLIWYASPEVAAEGRPRTAVTFLEGPGEWFRLIEDLDPEFLLLPDSLTDGLYLARFRIDYDADPYEPIEHVALMMLDAQRVPTPSRMELRSAGWAVVQAVRA